MKYILTLSLSGMCLAMFVFVVQGNAIGGDKLFGELIDQPAKAYAPVEELVPKKITIDKVTPDKVTTAKVEPKTVVAEPVVKERVTAVEKRGLTKIEAIREVLKDRTWEEAKPDVIRIINDYGTKRGEVRRDRAPIEKREYRERDYRAKVKEGITEEEAVAIALKDTPGEMIGVKWKKGNYRVKVWSEKNGATYKIYIDPQTGDVVRRKRK